jgi:hypothetical protein
MAPKHHPTPLSGGGRKALNKELGKSHAMTNILAAQSAEMRARRRPCRSRPTGCSARVGTNGCGLTASCDERLLIGDKVATMCSDCAYALPDPVRSISAMQVTCV